MQVESKLPTHTHCPYIRTTHTYCPYIRDPPQGARVIYLRKVQLSDCKHPRNWGWGGDVEEKNKTTLSGPSVPPFLPLIIIN